MLAVFLVSMALMHWLASSRFGLFIRSIREDEEAASALGVHIVRYKVLVFVITGMIAAAAGAVEAHYIGVITPNILLIMQMSLVIAMAVIGGLESLVGAAIGAIIIEFGLEFLRGDIGVIGLTITILTILFTIRLHRIAKRSIDRAVAIASVVLALRMLAIFWVIARLPLPRMAIGMTTGLVAYGLLPLLTIGLYWAAKRLIRAKDHQDIAIAIASVILALVISSSVAIPILIIFEIILSVFGWTLPPAIDMTIWRLVFFGLLLMLTLRFWNNGLFYPIIQRLTRAGVVEETVAKRLAAVEEQG